MPPIPLLYRARHLCRAGLTVGLTTLISGLTMLGSAEHASSLDHGVSRSGSTTIAAGREREKEGRVRPPSVSRPIKGFYGRRSEWTKDVRSAPTAANSRALVRDLNRQVTTRYNGNAAFNWDRFNIPFYSVGRGQPRADVIWDNCQGKQSEPAQLFEPSRGAHFSKVPIPAMARAAAGTDAALTVWSPNTDQLWEFWKARKAADGWHACWGGRIDKFSRSRGFFEDNMGVSASGLVAAAGTVGIREMRRGRINHAIKIGVPEVAYWREISYPAQRGDGSLPPGTRNAIREGQRFRLDPRVRVGRLGLTPIAAAVARAAQRYGMIVVDKAGCVTVAAESGRGHKRRHGKNPWRSMMRGVPSYKILENFPWSRLEALPVDYGKPSR